MEIYKVLRKYIMLKKGIKINVKGQSMKPTINAGDYVIIEDNISDLIRGDIILYWDNGFVLHRIIDILDGCRYITKGDHNRQADRGLINKECIIGRMLCTERKRTL